MKTIQPGNTPSPKGIRAIHTFTRTPVSPEDHQKLIDGPIRFSDDALDEVQHHRDVVPAHIRGAARK